MQYTQLGKTDLLVSRICFGCWQLSPAFWGEVPIEPWHNAIKAALDVGVNFIDTADAYGNGYAEESLGSFLKQENLRDRFIIATKFYWNFEKADRHPDTSYDYIIRECHASLKRLQTDHIDLYQIHAWDPLTRPDQVATALNDLRRQGKIRWIGVSNLNVEQISLYLRHMDVECLQPPYSLLARDIETRELPFCLEKRIGVIAYSPLYRGLLTGKYTPETTFDDSRANNPLFRGEAFATMLQGLAELKPIAAKHSLTLTQLALRWILTHPALSCAIVGIKKPDHITAAAAAAESLLPREDWYAVADHVKKIHAKALELTT